MPELIDSIGSCVILKVSNPSHFLPITSASTSFSVPPRIDNLSAVLIRFDSIPEKYIPTDEEVERNSRPDPAAASDGPAVGDTVI